MPPPDQSTTAAELLDEIRRANEGPEPDEQAEAMRRGIEYFAPMTPTERAIRHGEAQPVARWLNAVAERYGMRSMGWMITGPAEADAPPASDLERMLGAHERPR